MKTSWVICLLISPLFSLSQHMREVDSKDPIDIYWREQDLYSAKNKVRAKIKFNCIDTTKPPVPFKRVTFDKRVFVDSIICGSDLSKGLISGIWAFVRTIEEGDTIITGKGTFWRTLDYCNNHEFLSDLNTGKLKWPTNDSGHVLITIRYRLSNEGSIQKTVFDVNDKTVIDLQIEKEPSWSAISIPQKGKISVYQLGQDFEGNDLYFHASYLQRKIISDSMFITVGGNRQLFRHKIFLYDNKRRLLSQKTLDAQGLAESETVYSYKGNARKFVSFKETNFRYDFIATYRGDSQCDITEFRDLRNGSRIYAYRYNDRGLMTRYLFTSQDKVRRANCFEYEYF